MEYVQYVGKLIVRFQKFSRAWHSVYHLQTVSVSVFMQENITNK